MQLLDFIFPPSLVCNSLPSGSYLFIQLIEHEHPEDCAPIEIEVQLSEAPWKEQIVELFQHVKLENRDGIRVDSHDLLMVSYLFPIAADAREFRDQITRSSFKSNDIGGGLFSTGRARSEWTYRDTTLCQSWLILLNCDDETIANASGQRG